MRLDKLLANMGYGSRKEIKAFAKKGLVHVNGKMVKDVKLQIDVEADRVEFGGELVEYKEYVYFMLHKPPGVISATEDSREKTVIDLLQERDRLFNVFPVGRLDKDTEGLLVLTNDGQLAHKLLSPKKYVPKTYFARIQGVVNEEDIQAFSQGVTLEDGYETLPADLVIINSGDISEVQITIVEGKFHQVKRMFLARSKKVIYLKRISMGRLLLDTQLKIGEYRALSDEELELLQGSF